MKTHESAHDLLDRMFAVEMKFLSTDAHDIELLATAFHPEVVIHEPASLPYPGDWRGLDGLAGLFRAMSAVWSDLKVEGLQAARAGDIVFMCCTLRLEVRGSGTVIEQPFAEALRFEDGRLIEGTPFYHDTAALVAALTPASGV